MSRAAPSHALASAGWFDGQGDHHTPKPYVRQAFRKYLECGIFAHGFARAWCDDCGHDYFVAYSCKGRGVCPSCNTRRMVQTAAHLTDHVFPRLPVRVTPKTCWATSTAASPSTLARASKHTTGQHWSGCCATAPALCHGSSSQRGRCPGVPLRKTT